MFVYKIIKTVAFVILWMSCGISLEIAGPCIPDLKVRLGLNYEEISQAFIGPSISFIIGALMGGVIHQKLQRCSLFFFGICNIVSAVGISLVPWMTSLWSLGLVFSLSVLGMGANNIGVNAAILRLWGKELSGPPMFSVHFGFGLGGLLAPQIARPFISDVIHNTDDIFTNTHLNGSTDDLMNGTACHNLSCSTHPSQNPLIIFPFLISGGVCLTAALPFFVFQVLDCVAGETDDDVMDDDSQSTSDLRLCSVASCASDHTCYGLTMLFLLFLYYVQVVGGEHVYGKWIYTFAMETHTGFTKDEATLLLSLFWLSHMTGRGVGTVLSRFVHIQYIIAIDIIGLIICSITLCIWGHQVAMVLWVMTAAMGLLISPLYPAGLLFVNLYMRVNPVTLTIATVGASVGILLYVYTGGLFLEYFGTRSVMYILAAFAFLVAVVYICMHIAIKVHNRNTQAVWAVAKEMVYVSNEQLENIEAEVNRTTVIYSPKSYRNKAV